MLTGSDWTTIAELPKGSASGLGLPGGSATPAAGSGSSSSNLLGNITLGTPVSGAWGNGTLIETNLLSVLLVDDGRVFLGPVTPELLERAAS